MFYRFDAGFYVDPNINNSYKLLLITISLYHIVIYNLTHLVNNRIQYLLVISFCHTPAP